MRPSLLNPLFTELTRLGGVGPKIEKHYARLLGCSDAPRIVDLLLSNGPDAIAETKAWTLRSAWSDLSEKDFISLVESHSAKRQSAEAKEGLASFAEKRAAKWPTKG